MTNDVNITIKGVQQDAEDEPIVMTVPGTYHRMNGKHYIHYEESAEEYKDVSKNTIKVSSDRIIIMKKGSQTAQMIFDLNDADQAIYQTPFGKLVFETITKSIHVRETENELVIDMEYTLYNAEEKISDNRLLVTVEARG